MPDVDVDLIEETSLSLDDRGFWRKTRAYMITNLEPNERSAMEFEALSHVPQHGAPHETIPVFNFKVREMESEAVSRDQVQVTLTYSNKPGGGSSGDDVEVSEPPRIEVGGRVTSSQTNVDKDNNHLEIGYSGSDADDNVATVSFMVPQFTLRLRRRETHAPDDKAAAYVGKTNSDGWFGQSAGKWLCESIVGTSDDGGETYLVDYEFAFREGDSGKGWQAHVFFRDPFDGTIPAGVTEGDGEKFFQIYPQADFNALGLS